MLQSIQNYFSQSAWQTWGTNTIAKVPPAEWSWMYGYIAFFALCGVLAIAVHFLKIRPIFKEKLSSFFWTNFFLGLFLWFCRWQRIPYVGMDMLRLIHELTAIIWFSFIVSFIILENPKQKIQEKASERFNKYLPKQKSA